MYSQAQVPIPIHGNTLQCTLCNHTLLILSFKLVCTWKFTNYRIGTCIIYLTNSNTIKTWWYWPNTDADTGIGSTNVGDNGITCVKL